MMETIKDILSEILEVADAENGILAIHAPTLADRIEQAVKALEADRDNWRKQALDEDARAIYAEKSERKSERKSQ